MDLQPELFKIILIWCKDNLPSSTNIVFDSRNIKNIPFTQQAIDLHVDLLIEDGYIKTHPDGKHYIRLTSKG